jgi:hypothetical protein
MSIDIFFDEQLCDGDCPQLQVYNDTKICKLFGKELDSTSDNFVHRCESCLNLGDE